MLLPLARRPYRASRGRSKRGLRRRATVTGMTKDWIPYDLVAEYAGPVAELLEVRRRLISRGYEALPCPECGERGACAWDDEGRPLIHASEGTNPLGDPR